jgi:replicative DNA helicase
MTRDSEFLALYADGLIVEAIESNEVAFLLKRAGDYFAKYGAPLPRGILLMMLDEPRGAGDKLDPELVLKHYDEAPEPSVDERAYLFDHARDWFRQKMMLASMSHAAELIEQGQPDDAQELLTRSLTDVAGLGDTDYGVELIDGVDAYLEELDLTYGEGSSLAIPTGMVAIDGVMRGGLRPGELGVFMAPTGRGKSHALVSVARHAFLEGYNVAYYTLEMSAFAIQTRVWTDIIDRPNDANFANEAHLIKETIGKYADQGTPLGSLIVKAYPSRTATVQTLSGHLAALERNKEWKPDLVVVDYGDILAPSTRRKERRIEETEIFIDLHSIAQALNVGVWTGTQTNREAASRDNVRDIDVAEAWGKMMIADWVWGLSQNETKEKPKHKMRLTPVKTRNAESIKDIPFKTDFSRSKFIESDGGDE